MVRKCKWWLEMMVVCSGLWKDFLLAIQGSRTSTIFGMNLWNVGSLPECNDTTCWCSSNATSIKNRCWQQQGKMQTLLRFEDLISFGVKNTSEHMLRLTLCTYEEEFRPQSGVQFLWMRYTKTMERGRLSFASKIKSLRDWTSPNKPNKHAALVSPWCWVVLGWGRSFKRFFGHKVLQAWIF